MLFGGQAQDKFDEYFQSQPTVRLSSIGDG